MNARHRLDRLLGGEHSFRRRALSALSWWASAAFRDRGDPEKRALLRTVRRHTMASYRRLSNIYDLCREAQRSGLPGGFVECGAWKGGAAALMASVGGAGGRKTWLFDSFEGLPLPMPVDGPAASRYAGQCAARLEDVEHLLFETLKLDRARVEIRKGWFQDTLPQARAEIGPIALLRLDGDWYESTRLCLEHLYDGVVPGGFVILDDYGFWEGFRLAVDEFLAARDVRTEIRWVDRSGAYFEKP